VVISNQDLHRVTARPDRPKFASNRWFIHG
jgi:hypothetical protein